MHERIIKNKRKAGKKTNYDSVKRQSKHVYNCECVRICVCVCACVRGLEVEEQLVMLILDMCNRLHTVEKPANCSSLFIRRRLMRIS